MLKLFIVVSRQERRKMSEEEEMQCYQTYYCDFFIKKISESLSSVSKWNWNEDEV